MKSQEQRPAPSGKRPRSQSRYSLILVIAVMAVIVVATALAVESSSPGGLQYSCLSATQHGSEISVATSGIIHHIGSQYYISCNEGSSYPTTPASVSCLTITPKQTSTSYPGGQTTYLYYLTASSGTIAIQGAAGNATVITQPTTATVLVSCG